MAYVKARITQKHLIVQMHSSQQLQATAAATTGSVLCDGWAYLHQSRQCCTLQQRRQQ